MISTSVASLGGAILNAIASVAFGIFIGQKGFDFWFCAIKVLGGVARDSPDCHHVLAWICSYMVVLVGGSGLNVCGMLLILTSFVLWIANYNATYFLQ